MLYPDGKVPGPSFLSAEQTAEAAKEWARLCDMPAAPVFLGRAVLEFARSRPQDPRIPEALHQVVRSTRLGCTDKETSEYSRKAFTLLHKKYPESTWAKKTRYWY